MYETVPNILMFLNDCKLSFLDHWSDNTAKAKQLNNQESNDINWCIFGADM